MEARMSLIREVREERLSVHRIFQSMHRGRHYIGPAAAPTPDGSCFIHMQRADKLISILTGTSVRTYLPIAESGVGVD